MFISVCCLEEYESLRNEGDVRLSVWALNARIHKNKRKHNIRCWKHPYSSRGLYQFLFLSCVKNVYHGFASWKCRFWALKVPLLGGESAGFGTRFLLNHDAKVQHSTHAKQTNTHHCQPSRQSYVKAWSLMTFSPRNTCLIPENFVPL